MNPTAVTEKSNASKRGSRSSRPEPIDQERVDAMNDVDRSSTPKPPQHRLASLLIALLAVAAIIWIVVRGGDGGSDLSNNQSPTSQPIPAMYDADRSMGYLERLCQFGPRPSGSPAMKQQQDFLQAFFEEQGATVGFQSFEIRHPENGSAVPISNLIASWGSDRPKRFLLCAHYDTRPYPDQDRYNKRGIFIGANDGASGTAALMEMSHHFAALPPNIGVDVVLFDGEEFVLKQGRDDYFLGSSFYAEQYKANPPASPFTSGVLLDMIGDRELKIYFEVNSMKYARPVAKDIWRTAKRLGVKAFVPRIRHEIQDDHLPLNRIARIPTVDLIDFDYPRPGIGQPSYWHTQQDIPENCSGESLAAVVWVVHQWILEQAN